MSDQPESDQDLTVAALPPEGEELFPSRILRVDRYTCDVTVHVQLGNDQADRVEVRDDGVVLGGGVSDKLVPEKKPVKPGKKATGLPSTGN